MQRQRDILTDGKQPMHEHSFSATLEMLAVAQRPGLHDCQISYVTLQHEYCRKTRSSGFSSLNYLSKHFCGGNRLAIYKFGFPSYESLEKASCRPVM